MTREVLLKELNNLLLITSSKHLDEAITAKNNILDGFDDFESRLCKNCKWHQEDLCVNGDSPLCADFVDGDYGCVLFERKE